MFRSIVFEQPVSSAQVLPLTSPEHVVRALRSWSWYATKTLSAVSCTSNSTPSIPRARPPNSASRLSMGNSASRPRPPCPMMCTPLGSGSAHAHSGTKSKGARRVMHRTYGSGTVSASARERQAERRGIAPFIAYLQSEVLFPGGAGMRVEGVGQHLRFGFVLEEDPFPVKGPTPGFHPAQVVAHLDREDRPALHVGAEVNIGNDRRNRVEHHAVRSEGLHLGRDMSIGIAPTHTGDLAQLVHFHDQCLAPLGGRKRRDINAQVTKRLDRRERIMYHMQRGQCSWQRGLPLIADIGIVIQCIGREREPQAFLDQHVLRVVAEQTASILLVRP